jgi:hypothetical protein
MTLLAASNRTFRLKSFFRPVAGLMRVRSGFSGKKLKIGPVWAMLASTATTISVRKSGPIRLRVSSSSSPSQAAIASVLQSRWPARASTFCWVRRPWRSASQPLP